MKHLYNWKTLDRSSGIAITLLALIGLFWVGAARPEPINKKTPQQILIIRHGEKPADKSDHGLDKPGKLRAEALHELFEKSPKRPHPFPTPDFIFAAADSSESHRPKKTVEPLAKKLGIEVNLSFHSELEGDEVGAKAKHKGIQDLAKEIFGHDRYVGKTILICWHQGVIPELARALKAGDSPTKWDGDSVFDRVWIITYSDDGKTTFADRPQLLMPHDKGTTAAHDSPLTAVTGKVSGKVQEVGFRAMILRNAIAGNLAGWAENNADKTVSFVLQGDKSRIKEALAMIAKGTEESADVKVASHANKVDPQMKTFLVKDWTSTRADITNKYNLVFTVRSDDSKVSEKEAERQYHAILEKTLSPADLKKLHDKKARD